MLGGDGLGASGPRPSPRQRAKHGSATDQRSSSVAVDTAERAVPARYSPASGLRRPSLRTQQRGREQSRLERPSPSGNAAGRVARRPTGRRPRRFRLLGDSCGTCPAAPRSPFHRDTQRPRVRRGTGVIRVAGAGARPARPGSRGRRCGRTSVAARQRAKCWRRRPAWSGANSTSALFARVRRPSLRVQQRGRWQSRLERPSPRGNAAGRVARRPTGGGRGVSVCLAIPPGRAQRRRDRRSI